MRSRISSRRVARRTIGLLFAMVLVTTPAVVLADHQFDDVPDGHPFHDPISAVAKAGITTGFSDGGYHPSEAVTRQAMAAFMHRGFGRVGLAVGNLPTTSSVDVAAGATSTSFVPVRELTMVVPGASNAFNPQQLVHLQGRVHFLTSMIGFRGCPCTFAAIISDTTTAVMSWEQLQTFESTSGSFYYSFDVEALFAAPPGARTYQLEVRLALRDNTTNAASFLLDLRSSLSATSFPFGPAGTSALWTAGAQNVVPADDQLPERRPTR